MLFGYQRKPPFGRWLAAATDNGLLLPAWLFSTANEFIAHLHAALAVMHDPTTGEHRQIDSLYAMASLDFDSVSGEYTFRWNQGFVDPGAFAPLGTGSLYLYVAEEAPLGSVAWFGNQVRFDVSVPTQIDLPRIKAWQANVSIVQVDIRYPKLTPGPAWQPVNTNFWVAGVRTRPVED